MYFIFISKVLLLFLDSEWFSEIFSSTVIPNFSLDFEIKRAIILQYFVSNNTLILTSLHFTIPQCSTYFTPDTFASDGTFMRSCCSTESLSATHNQ